MNKLMKQQEIQNYNIERWNRTARKQTQTHSHTEGSDKHRGRENKQRPRKLNRYQEGRQGADWNRTQVKYIRVGGRGHSKDRKSSTIGLIDCHQPIRAIVFYYFYNEDFLA